MDIKDKLSYYKSNSNKQEQNQQSNISPSLKAIAEEFNAEICQSLAPYLKISRIADLNPALLPEGSQNLNIDLTFLDKKSQNTTFQLDDCVFFDLETTGLMGGSGTFAFLLGFASLTSNQIKVDQYFLPDFGREYYLFKELNTWLSGYKNLVSYNGKSYDFPLLKSRYIMNHIEPVITNMIHYDLLHFARRVWKDALPSCDLISIEQNILDRHRSDDIPGWLIPQSYFDFLNTGVIHEMIRIIEHNFYDLVSLTELILVLNRISNLPAGENNLLVLRRLAYLASQKNEHDIFNNICTCIEQISGRISHSLIMEKSLMHKRNNDWQDAIQLWEILVESPEYTFFALEELAKYYEHQKKDIQKALEYTIRALNALDLLNQLDRYDRQASEYQNKFNHRRERLSVKLS